MSIYMWNEKCMLAFEFSKYILNIRKMNENKTRIKKEPKISGTT